MTDRDALAQILESKWWAGYKLIAPTDARKVELEFQGVRRPQPSSTFARGLVELCRNNPFEGAPEPPPPPPPVPAPTGVVPFDKLLFLRHPNGGVEDLDRMRQAGFLRVAVNTGDHPAVQWGVVKMQARKYGVMLMPWARCRTPTDVTSLLVAAKELGAQQLIVNVEGEIETTLPPAEITSRLALWTGDVGLSTEAWLQNTPDWGSLAARGWCVMPQIFPIESKPAKDDPAGCLAHARGFGFTRVAPTYGAYGGMTPGMFDTSIPHSWFTGDDMGGDYGKWPA